MSNLKFTPQTLTSLIVEMSDGKYTDNEIYSAIDDMIAEIIEEREYDWFLSTYFDEYRGE